jgi:nicotinate-nucleotide adenylyltransferase
MPANSSPHKRPEQDPGADHRLRMCELAVAADGTVEACALELARPAPSYTVETLEQLHASQPEASWTFIAGADTARTMPSWRRPGELLALAHLAVALRAGSSREEVLRALSQVRDGAPLADAALGRVSFIEMPPVDISSSQVRKRVARGEPVAELVGESVARYIAEEGLYLAPEMAST